VIAPAGGLTSSATFFEGAIDAVQNAVEANIHEVRERVTGGVVRRDRRTAGIAKVVGVVLGLKHIEHVRAECLRGLHDIRSGRIILSACRKLTRGAVDRNAAFQQDVDELDRSWEIGLVGRKDVGTGVPQFGLVEDPSYITREKGWRTAAWTEVIGKSGFGRSLHRRLSWRLHGASRCA